LQLGEAHLIIFGNEGVVVVIVGGDDDISSAEMGRYAW
jgi:hypothetical protein